MRRTFRALALIATVSLAACIRVAPFPAVNISVSKRAPAAGSDGWRRSVRDADGREIGNRSASGPIQVEWSAPVPFGSRPDGAWVGVERDCGLPTPASAWFVGDRATRARSVDAELWQVVDAPPTRVRSRTPESLAVSSVLAAAVLAETPLDLNEAIRWIAYLPSNGHFDLVFRWERIDGERALRVRPCPIRWVPITLALLVRATAQEGRQKGSDGAGAAVSADPDTAVTRAERTLGLIGTPTYDLARLHQVALAREFGGSTPAGVTLDALRWLRDDRVRRLAAGADAAATFCDLGVRRHLFDVRLKLWEGDATLPLRFRGGCAADGSVVGAKLR